MEPMPTPAGPPVSSQEYDFRTERVANMSQTEVDAELARIDGASPSHPYMAGNDRRHGAATDFALALRERQIALRPPRDEAAQKAEELAVRRLAEGPRRYEAEALRRKMVNAGFSDFDLPEEVQDFHLAIMKRDLLIQEGKLSLVIPDLLRELSALGLDREPGIQQTLGLLNTAGELSRDGVHPVTQESELDRNKDFKEIAMDAAFSLHRAIARRLNQRYAMTKEKIAEEKAKRQAGGLRP